MAKRMESISISKENIIYRKQLTDHCTKSLESISRIWYLTTKLSNRKCDIGIDTVQIDDSIITSASIEWCKRTLYWSNDGSIRKIPLSYSIWRSTTTWPSVSNTLECTIHSCRIRFCTYLGDNNDAIISIDRSLQWEMDTYTL